MKKAAKTEQNSSVSGKEAQENLAQKIAQLDESNIQAESAADPQSPDNVDPLPESNDPVITHEPIEETIPARDGGVDGRNAFGGNRLLDVVKKAIGGDLSLPQALGNERNLSQAIADTIEANYFSPFYEGEATDHSPGRFLTSVSEFGLTSPFAPIVFAPPHLAPLIDESIERLTQTDPFESLFPVDFTNNVLFDDAPPPDAVVEPDYETTEDNQLEASLFPAPVAGFDPTIVTPPTNGTLVFNDDGSFVFTPDPDFSGVQEVEIEFIDPNNGRVRIETLEFTVEPVLDVPVLVDGVTSVSEDDTIPLGQDIDISMEDATDGSQTLSIVLDGIPADVVVTAITNGDVTLVQQPDGSYILSGGTPADVLAALDTLVLDAPEHDAEDFDVQVTATATEEDGSQATVTANHSVTIEEVADEPFAVGGNFTTDEDTPVTLTGLDGGLVDTDGSEVLGFTLSDVPAGANFSGAGTFDPATNLWTFTPEEIEAGLTFVPPPEQDGTFEFTLTAIATETENGDQATASALVTVVIAPVVDPIIVADGASAAPEDQPIPLGQDLDISLDDPTGAQSLEIELDGIPPLATIDFTTIPGVSVVDNRATGGSLVISGPNSSDVLAFLDTLTVRPEGHNADDFDVDVTITTAEPDEPPQTVSLTQSVVVTPVVDNPTVTPDVTFSTDEDTSIALIGLGGELVDQDGSEVLTFELANVPDGADFNGAGTFDPVTGVWTFTEAEIDAGLIFVPPEHVHGTFVFDFTAVSTETETGDVARTTSTVTIDVEAEADAPLVSGSSAINEDNPLALGDDIDIGLVDQDGSETLSVSISGFPFTSADQFDITNIGGATAFFDPATGTLTISGGTAQDVLDTLATATATPNEHDDQDFDLTISATTTDADGSTATTNHTHPVTVTAVADAPDVSDTSSTINEDTLTTIGGDFAFALVDTDGTEAVTGIVLTGIPSDWVFDATDSGTAGFVFDPVAGTVTITSSSADRNVAQTDIEAVLATLEVQAPADSDVDLAIGVEVTTTDNDGSTATGTGTHTIEVDAVADGVTITGSSTGDEDTPIAIGSSISIVENDADGSERVTGITIANIPTGADAPDSVTLDGSEPATVSFNYDAVSGEVTISSSNPDEEAADAEIRAALATLTITPDLHSDDDFTLNVSVDVLDNDGATTTNTVAHAVTVTAVADAPDVSDTSSTINEDTLTTIGGDFAFALVDTDGTEAVTGIVLTGIPSDWVFDATDSGTAGFVFDPVAGTVTITSSSADRNVAQTDIEAVLATLEVQAPADSDVDLAIGVEVTTTDNDGSTATGTGTHTIEVDAVADGVTITGSSTGDEDTPIAIGSSISIVENDADGSERVTGITIANIPTGADAPDSVTLDGSEPATVSFNYDAVSGEVTISSSNPDEEAADAEIRAALATLTITPDLHSDDDFTLNVSVDVLDNDGATTTNTVAQAVTVTAVADAPTANADVSVTTDEDVPIEISGIGATASLDADGSETLTFVVSGVPAGASFDSGTDNGDGTYTFTAAELAANPEYTPVPGFSGTVNLTLTARSTEARDNADGLNFEEDSHAITITVNPVVDPATFSGSGSEIVNEDTVINVGQNIGMDIDDASDGSTDADVVFSGIPANATIDFTSFSGIDVIDTRGSDGLVRFDIPDGSSATVQDLLNLIETFTVTPASDTDQNFDVSVSVAVFEVGSGLPPQVGGFIHRVTVQAVADAPTVSGAGGDIEDASSPISVPITVGLTDTDGTEEITSVEIANIPAGATFDFTGTPPTGVSVVNAGGTATVTVDPNVFTGTLATLNTFLGTATIIAPANSGDDINLSVTAVSTETAPSEPGDVSGGIAVPTASTTETVVVDIVPQADVPNVVAPDDRSIEEDETITLTGQSGSLNDNDGSETLTYQITANSLPAGVSLSDLSFTTAGGASIPFSGGAFQLTASQLAGLQFTPASNASGTFDLRLTAIATDAATDDPETTANAFDDFVITVDPQADAPLVSGLTVVNEDAGGTGLVNFGSNVNVSTADSDGSETISSVTLSNFAGPAAAIASIAFDNSIPNVTIDTSTPGVFVITSSNSGAAAEADIQAALDSFELTLDTHDDDNITFDVVASSVDQDGSSASSTAVEHLIRVRAVADTPTAAANDVSGVEDTPISLNLSAGDSVDLDGSETLSARISDLPTGSVITSSLGSLPGNGTLSASGGNYTVTADTTADLNAILASLQLELPDHFPASGDGSFTATLEVISTEGATGNEVAVATASVTDTFSVDVEAVADGAVLTLTDATGANAGFEDTPIRIAIEADLIDDDGSEVITELVITGVPAGARFVDGPDLVSAGDIGTQSGPDGDGNFTYTFNEAEAAAIFGAVPPAIFIVPPEHSNDDFSVNVSITTTEQLPGNAGDSDSVTTGPQPLAIEVIGVADAVPVPMIEVVSVEDQPVMIGQQINAAVSGLLVDTDGSETAFLVVSGLPAGFIPDVGTLIGPGTFQIPFADLDSFTLPSEPDFSGDYLADVLPGFSLSFITQENDGNQLTTPIPAANLSIEVTPVVDGASLNRGVTVTEDTSISLANADNFAFLDNDGSETLVDMTFDLTNLIADAGIGTQLDNLNGPGSDINTFIANHINGTFTDNGDGTITVLAANVDGISFDTAPFLDSNRDFDISVSANFIDTAVPDAGTGDTVVDGPVQFTGTFSINLVGDADVPTAVVQNASGDANTPIELDLSGVSTDTDDDLGEGISETLDYIVQLVSNPDDLNFAFSDAAGEIIGTPLPGDAYSFTAAELAQVHLLANGDSNAVSPLEFTLTSIARENDGDVETFTAPGTFQVEVDTSVGPGPGTPPAAPGFPSTTSSPISEDSIGVFDATVTSEPGTATGVVFSDLPPGLIIIGAIFDPRTGDYFASADDVNNGDISFELTGPLANSDEDISITIEAVSTNSSLQSTSSGEVPFTIPVTAVADGPTFAIADNTGDEDTELALGLSIGLADNDGSETISSDVEIIVPDGVVLNNAGAGVSSGGFTTYTVPAGSLGSVSVDPALNASESFDLTVRATSQEASNGDTEETEETFTITIEAEADEPLATADDVVGVEDTPIALTGLSAALVDTDGSEILSVTISGLPDDTLLSAGSANGDGSFSIPVADLATLVLTPPRNFSGVMNLSLNAFALDEDGSLATTTVPFTVTVDSVADDVALLPVPVSGDEDTPIVLDLGITQGDDSEILELVFTNVSDGVITASGGTLVDNGGGQFTFTGTAAEAEALSFLGDQDFSGNVSFDVAATSITDDASAKRSATVNSPVDVTVNPVADPVTLAPVDVSGDADQILDVDLAVDLEVDDETVELVITGVENGILIAGGGTLVDDGNGQFTFTGSEAEANTLQFDPDDTFNGDVVLNIAATPIDEGDRGTTVNDTITLTVDPVSLNLTGNAGNNTLTGGDLGDVIDGAGGNDIITGGLGGDLLTGGSGADDFVYNAGDNDGNADTITDFSTTDGDVLDLTDLVDTQGNPVEDFLSISDDGTDTTVSVDVDGNGPGGAVDLVVLEDVTGESVTDLVDNGHIIVNSGFVI